MRFPLGRPLLQQHPQVFHGNVIGRTVLIKTVSHDDTGFISLIQMGEQCFAQNSDLLRKPQFFSGIPAEPDLGRFHVEVNIRRVQEQPVRVQKVFGKLFQCIGQPGKQQFQQKPAGSGHIQMGL